MRFIVGIETGDPNADLKLGAALFFSVVGTAVTLGTLVGVVAVSGSVTVCALTEGACVFIAGRSQPRWTTGRRKGLGRKMLSEDPGAARVLRVADSYGDEVLELGRRFTTQYGSTDVDVVRRGNIFIEVAGLAKR